MVLVHGFGASVGHWRYTWAALSDQARVHALDLLGFGASDKPPSRLDGEVGPAGSVRYCFDLWGQQVADFCTSVVLADPAGSPGDAAPPRLVLIGNSIGGLVVLTAARLLRRQGLAPAEVVLIDCAQRTLDDKRAQLLPAWEQLSRPLVKQLVRQRWIVGPLFRLLAQPGFIRQVLKQAYPSGAHIDDDLVALLHRPSTDPGAAESFRGFVNLFNDHLGPDLLTDLSAGPSPVPVRMIWGEQDPWEDPAEARRWAEQFDCIQELQVLPGVGHCPHDEAPELVNPILRDWLP